MQQLDAIALTKVITAVTTFFASYVPDSCWFILCSLRRTTVPCPATNVTKILFDVCRLAYRIVSCGKIADYIRLYRNYSYYTDMRNISDTYQVSVKYLSRF